MISDAKWHGMVFIVKYNCYCTIATNVISSCLNIFAALVTGLKKTHPNEMTVYSIGLWLNFAKKSMHSGLWCLVTYNPDSNLAMWVLRIHTAELILKLDIFCSPIYIMHPYRLFSYVVKRYVWSTVLLYHCLLAC